MILGRFYFKNKAFSHSLPNKFEILSQKATKKIYSLCH
jgi:hypothetical protein